MAKSGMTESEVDADETDENVLTIDTKSPKTTNNVISKRKITVSTPISILIESLVKNLCSICEPDSKKSDILYNIICEKLFQMNMIDESYSMDEFEGMRTEYQKAFHHLFNNSVENSGQLALRPIWPNNDFMNSHYYKEFEEVDYIAGGGFGQVFKVRHKLDGAEYAVKKITIQSEGIESVRNYLSEVKTFASMNHSNIVQYKAAWLELGAPQPNSHIQIDQSESYITSDLDSSDVENIRHNMDQEYIYKQEESYSFPLNNFQDSSSDFEIDFEHSINSMHSSFVNLPSTNKRKREKRDSVSEGGKSICKLDKNEIRKLQIQHKSQIKWATLYIQMALCQSTLKQWLENRNLNEGLPEKNDNLLVPVLAHVRNETIYEVLRQLLKGLEYIHSKGIVHHDIKPSNIFIQLENGNLLVQLGDFGLACPLQNVRHSLALGTKLYAAPEQLAGKCDPKSDMYSLGIVLFELAERFRTDMERIHFINELRKGNFPEHFITQQPDLHKIILQLIIKQPENRPNATSLLNSISNSPDVCKKIEELECQVAEKDKEILRLKELLRSAGLKSI